MGLDADFLSLLTVPVGVRKKTGTDQWGNETYSFPQVASSFIDASNASWGRTTPTSFRESQQAATATIYLDALGLTVGDKIVYDSTDHWVTDLVNYKDEAGADLFQIATVSDQKKG